MAQSSTSPPVDRSATPTGEDTAPTFEGIERPRVILVHGIRTDGNWIVDARPLLEPFFEVVPIHYRHYRHLGAVKLAVEPLVILLGVLIGWISVYLVSRPWLPWWLTGWAAVVLASAYMMRRLRLDSALRNFVLEFSEKAERPGRPPNLVAHSLGSYLAGAALLEHPGITFRRVILCGCVLRRDFPWARLRGDAITTHFSLGRVESVRNEIGLRDWVPRIAEYLSRFSVGFGSAGRDGFVGNSSVVHDVFQADGACPRCDGRGSGVLVHNIHLPFDHNSGFIGGLHCKSAWVPYLLGYDPAEYNTVLRLCRTAAEQHGRNHSQLRKVEQKLRNTRWNWCRGPLRARILQRISDSRPELKHDRDFLVDLADHALGIFWRRVDRAAREFETKKGAALPRRLQELDLFVAMERAVEAVTRQL